MKNHKVANSGYFGREKSKQDFYKTHPSAKTKAIHKRLNEENKENESMERRKNLLGSIRRGE